MNPKPKGVVGHISAQDVNAKRDHYRDLAVPAFDAVYDAERGDFLIAGKHELAVGEPTVFRLPLEGFLMSAAQVIANNVVPIIMANRRVVAAKKAD